METLKKNGKHLVLVIIGIIFASAIHAQSDLKVIESAFESSYSMETKGEYANAVSTLKAVYNETSYEINLRLGWLTYLSGLFTESTAYYQKAIKLKPYSIEAKLAMRSRLLRWETGTR